MDWLKSEIRYHIGWTAQSFQAAGTLNVLNANLQSLSALLKDTSSVLKHDQTTTVIKLELALRTLVLKRYNARNQGHKVKRALRMSRARRCWDMSYAFARAGLNVAPPLLMFEQRFGPIRLNTYFASDFLRGEELLTALPNMNSSQKATVVSSIKSAFEKMHAAKLTHGDMKASNLLWVDNALYFIDLDAAQHHRYELTWRVKHAKDKKRFLKNWQSQPELLTMFSEL